MNNLKFVALFCLSISSHSFGQVSVRDTFETYLEKYQNHEMSFNLFKDTLSDYFSSLPDDDPNTHYEKIFKRSVYFWEDRSSLDSLGVLSTDLYTKRMIDYQFDEPRTQKLLRLLSNEKAIKKIFIEPHLKNRMYLNSSKIRYHGCQAVRNDDHIHVEL